MKTTQKQNFSDQHTTFKTQSVHQNNIYEVDFVSSEKIILKDIKNNKLDAELALSCIMIPQQGDIVSTVSYKDDIYITSIIKSYSLEPKQYHLKGLVKAGLDESYLNISPQKIELKTRKINLISHTLSALSKVGKWLIDGMTIKSKTIHQESVSQNISCKETLDISAQNRKVDITDIDSQSAKVTIQDSKQINITTDKLNINS
ncbi:hypothetical protein LO80_01660 [Candidatus Francisella endociliophora]|uniref:DUF3540 domain-containing protein n=1 Tax=Candidatus Francisella endociliophora TaxID=653937 RepID=A0A097EMN0_9GAMM|nr:DUF3540 domain-containing protein [Francisella sp. FSC1006]AIT08808.1 hypothetical protein LO80_01660 [Francisella sp. FSC1006]